MDYTEAYNSAKSRYNEAAGNVSSYASAIKGYKEERTTIINNINALEKKLKEHKDVLEDITSILGRKSESEATYNRVDSATEAAGTVYRGLATISTITAKNFDVVFSEEMTATNNSINQYYSSLRTAQGIMNGKIFLIEMDLKNERVKLDDINEKIAGAEGQKGYWEGVRNSAAGSMAYYWPLMQAQEAFS